MNVALTRAKSSLFILGNAPTLERSDATWKSIVLDARSRSALFDVRMLHYYYYQLCLTLVQVDPTYFTRPTMNQPPPVMSPTKEATAVPSVPVPSDLVTPRDYKLSIGRATEPQPLQAVTDRVPPANGVGVKRPAQDDDDGAQPLPPRPGEGTAKPRIPPLKRPKPPPNIFIPRPNKVKVKH